MTSDGASQKWRGGAPDGASQKWRGGAPGAKRILLVEDEDVIRTLCRRLLGGNPRYDLISVESVQEARRRIKEGGWDLLITDLRLPDGDGVEVIEALRVAQEGGKIMIVTGSPTPEDRMDRIRKMEVEAYINKPFEVEALLEAVEKALG